MKMNVLIVDDEFAGRNTLLILLKSHCTPFINVMDAVSSLEDAIHLIGKNKYDLVFLDIHLKEKSGFDLVQFIPDTTKIVIVTAFSEYAITAIKNKAFDFFLKPVDGTELLDCVKKCFSLFKQQVRQFLTIKHNGLTIPLEFQNILLLKAKGPYAEIFETNGKVYITSQTLKSLEPKLNETFLRVHKSYIVNRSYIKGYNQKELILNELNVPISRNGHLMLQEYFSV